MPFPIRHAIVRTVNPNAQIADYTETSAISIWRMALAASQETLQTGLLTAAWLRLFGDQLSQVDGYWLRWQDMRASAEIRRAQSVLYGRYLARGMLGSRLNAQYFVPLRRNTTILANGVEVRRNRAGDIPDWIAWVDRPGGYILGEAKGMLSGSPTSLLRQASRAA